MDLIYSLGTLSALQLHGWDSSIGVFVCLYRPPPSALRFARELRAVPIGDGAGHRTEEYPFIQVISVEEMSIDKTRPSLPMVAPKFCEVVVQQELPFELSEGGRSDE